MLELIRANKYVTIWLIPLIFMFIFLIYLTITLPQNLNEAYYRNFELGIWTVIIIIGYSCIGLHIASSLDIRCLEKNQNPKP